MGVGRDVIPDVGVSLLERCYGSQRGNDEKVFTFQESPSTAALLVYLAARYAPQI